MSNEQFRSPHLVSQMMTIVAVLSVVSAISLLPSFIFSEEEGFGFEASDFVSVRNQSFIGKNDQVLKGHGKMLSISQSKSLGGERKVMDIRRPNATTTVAMYVGLYFDDPIQQKKLADLYAYFGSNFFVVIDERERTPRGGKAIESVLRILPSKQQIITKTQQKVTRTHRFNFKGRGLEMALMWLIDHPDVFDFAWFVEPDVYWTDSNTLVDFFESHKASTIDLLHQNQGMELDGKGADDKKLQKFPYFSVVPPQVSVEAGFDPLYYHGLFNFYRISKKLIQAVNTWRLSVNDGQWAFFETLLPTFAIQATNITTQSYLNSSRGYSEQDFHLRYRPCYIQEEIEKEYEGNGIFHPVKDGFQFCDW